MDAFIPLPVKGRTVNTSGIKHAKMQLELPQLKPHQAKLHHDCSGEAI